MAKVLRVTCEFPGRLRTVTEYFRLNGDESESDKEATAETVFSNYASYGFDVVDESEVPSGAEIQGM
ncbi:MAG TPA: hypothetical protein PKA76_19510 [Pirellulaceae bacterium]|nr:hypothetical protein [Pirellulaceae bacterium]